MNKHSTPLAEKSLYPFIRQWLEKWLSHRYNKVSTYDTSNRRLNQMIQELGIAPLLPEHWVSWDIRVDILGIGYEKRKPDKLILAFVECKVKPITLQHLGQLLGYCRVAQPKHAFLISPEGVSTALRRLLDFYRRESILYYGESVAAGQQKILLARWDTQNKTVAEDSWLPQGEARIGSTRRFQKHRR